ncbi:MAG: ATP-binding cassette domain-containing protein, partial [Pseudoalteromonas sp.]|uniref:ATP-binding cassette domain-containing protein n=1 Tax=Pseudoalteromonas sp. TaxID=53249 RepID=UPI001DE86ACB
DFILHLAGNSSEVLCFFAIGMIVFSLPRDEGGDHQSLLGIIMALLYITAPVSTILGLIQQLKMGAISLEKINKIYKVRRGVNNKLGIINGSWSSFSLSGVNYSYSVGDKSFSIKEVSLSLSRGGIYFVVGGNGSGKSTLCKIISLHYRPEGGDLYLDNEVLNRDALMSFRQCFFVIYSDFYLFDTIYKKLDDKDYFLIRKYLKVFELDNKTQIINNKFTTINLSDGQRRRLALLVALVEDKDIFVLDEWAADQDPKFKKLFYQTLLPDLKRKGKTVVCVTHDDRYFYHCDQVIKMEDGKVIDIYKPVTK